MVTKFLRITFASGSAVISGPYTKLVNLKAYVRRVLSGAEPLVVWRNAATVHPLTGAPAVMRERTFMPSREVTRIEEVVWAGASDSTPDTNAPTSPLWVIAPIVTRGEAGIFRVKTQRIADLTGLPIGTVLPVVKRDFYGVTADPCVWLNATGERTFRPRTATVWENGYQVQPPPMDDDDAAATDGDGIEAGDDAEEF